jgi:hypothetical protein
MVEKVEKIDLSKFEIKRSPKLAAETESAVEKAIEIINSKKSIRI